MLHFILGKVSSGKTEYLHKLLGEKVKTGENTAILVVPEQFTFETDKGILDTLGAEISNKIDVFSFTRLAETCFEENAVEKNSVISRQGRILFIAKALSSLQDKLEIYSNQVDKPAFLTKMLLVIDEFKQSNIDKQQSNGIICSLHDGLLKRKLKELFLITDVYDALVSQKYNDTTDELTQFCEVLKTTQYLKGKTVAIDGFISFNAQILSIIEQMLIQCEDVYITLTAEIVWF